MLNINNTPNKPVLLELKEKVLQQEVLNVANAGRIFACDFHVVGAEQFTEKPWGYEEGRIVNIDHHAPTPFMRRHISSTNLALEYIQTNGAATVDETVVINHTDCDSVLAAALMTGAIDPLSKFGEAAIAADHTGKKDVIADLLQALDSKRDYNLSLNNLRKLLVGETLDVQAQEALHKRAQKREMAVNFVNNGTFSIESGIASAVLEESIDGEFLPALIPDAVLIITFTPLLTQPPKWNAKMRLGNAAPAGLSISDIILPFDEGYGGRWNAGSNKRAGGSIIEPESYVQKIIENMPKCEDHRGIRHRY